MTFLSAIQALIALMKPSPPNFIYERQDFANIKVDALSPVKPVVVYVQDYSGSFGGSNMITETQNLTIAFLYKTEFEMDEMVQNAPLRAKAMLLAKQFYKLMVASNYFQPLPDARYTLVFDRYFDAAYVGIALTIDAKLQPGECYAPIWTGILGVTPTAAQSVVAAGGIVTYSVTGNTDWTVTSNQSWAVVGTASGFEEGSSIITVAANATGIARSATITFAGVGVTSLTRTINQAG